jgi:hypothetical protein
MEDRLWVIGGHGVDVLAMCSGRQANYDFGPDSRDLTLINDEHVRA